MKVILLIFDSLNRHFLETYGSSFVETPNFKRLEKHSVVFDRHYVGSLPCIPARREMHAGRYNFLHRSWGPLEPFDDSMPEILKMNDVYTHLVTDHQHYWEDGGATYHNRYNSYEFVRGQEADKWKAHVDESFDKPDLGNSMRQDRVNRQYLQEDNFPIDEVFNLAMDFLETNKNSDNWFLQIESFDPHEPYFTKKSFDDKFPQIMQDLYYDWPNYSKVNESEEELRHIRAKYASLLSMVDEKLGLVLDFLDKENMWEDTAILVTTDHGFFLGEHGFMAKSVHPLYEEVSHIPLYYWNPKINFKNVRNDLLTQTIDIPATILDLFNISIPASYTGKSLNKALKDEVLHDYILFGMHGSHVNITDGEYVFMKSYDEENKPLFNYTLMPMNMKSMFSIDDLKKSELVEGSSYTKDTPVLKVPSSENKDGDLDIIDVYGDELYKVSEDRSQENESENKKIEQKLKMELVKLMIEFEAPIEQFERLELLDEYYDCLNQN